MKNLRQLLNRSGLLRSEKRRGHQENASRTNPSRRRLSNELLEKRELLAGDFLAANHNYWYPYDVNDDGRYSARDALAIINYMDSANNSIVGETVADGERLAMFYDVNADHRVSAADALGVINAMSRGEGTSHPLIELLLTARTPDMDPVDPLDNGQPITPDGNGVINVEVGQPFDLEVSYNELRFFQDRLGAFQLYVDLAVSEPNNLVPILNETQLLVIGEEITQNTSGSLTFSIEGSATTYVSQFADLAQNTTGEVVNALTAFGYSADQYEIESVSFRDNNDIGRRIHWVGDQFGNVDLPDIMLTSNFPTPVPVQVVEFAPFNPDGSVNSDAVQFNINSFSRTFNDNERFYSTFNRGTYDPATGFANVGGLGGTPSSGGGIPQLTDDGGFITPFDAYSLRVMFTQAATGFVVGVNPGEDVEATLLYGRDDAVPQDRVLIDEDANVTFNVSPGQVAAPIAGDSSLSVTEDITATLDLAPLLSGGAFTSLAVTTNGNRGSASISGTTLTYVPSLNQNGTDTIVYTASNSGGSDTGTIAVTIDAVNDPPEPDDDAFSTTVDTALVITFAQLLDGDIDVDGDQLMINSASQPTNAGASTAFDANANTVTYTPAAGFTGTDTFTYNVGDGTVAVDATVTITIGQVSAPIANDGTLNVTEDITQTLDLSTLLSGGPPNSLTVTTNGNRGSASISGTTLTYVPTLNENGSDTVVYTASNAGGSDTGTIAITIAPVNDAPVPDNESFNVDQDSTLTIQLADLLDGDVDVDGDVLSVNGVGQPNLAGAVTTLNGVVTYTPPAGVTGSDFFTYSVFDGTTSVNGRVDITINLIAPVAADGALSAAQNGNGTLDLATLLSGGAFDSLTVTDGATGTTSLSGTVVTYTPNPGVTASDTFTYTATNSQGSDTGTISVTVTTVPQPPVVSGPISATFGEEVSGTVNLLDNASDPENGPLNVVGLSVTGGAAGIVVNGNSLTITANANGSLVDNESVSNVYTYSVEDNQGLRTAHSATVTINGFNDPPRARDDNGVIAFVDISQEINVLNNDDAGQDEVNQTFTVVSATSNDGNATVTPNSTGSAVTFTPNSGFTGSTTFDYTIRDAQGKEDTATVSVTVQSFTPRTIGGAIFVDYVENVVDVIENQATPFRDGLHDENEPGVGGVLVRLQSDAANNLSGQSISINTWTNLNGDYEFDGLAPGTYTVMAFVDGVSLSDTDKLIYQGTGRFDVSIAQIGGQDVGGLNFPVLGTSGNALNNVEILASTHVNQNPVANQLSNGGRRGGVVSLANDGSQNFFIAREGFEGVQFAEIAVNTVIIDGVKVHNKALLTIVDQFDNIRTAQLNSSQFLASRGDGPAVQIFGGVSQFQFTSALTDQAIRQEFPNYLSSVDAAFAAGLFD